MRRLLGSNQHTERWGQAAALADADWFNLLLQAEQEALEERKAAPVASEGPARVISRRPLEWERVTSTTEVA
jgi:hypothetical protein